MDKLPCSTSFLMSVNFDGLKEVIDFLHKNINILNEKINDLNKKFNGFEDIKAQIYENKIKTESSLRLLNELDERVNNFSENLLKNSEKTNSNEEKINKISQEIEKIQISNNNNLENSSNEKENKEIIDKLFENYKELKEEMQKENSKSNDNIDKINEKINILEQKLNSLNTNMDINNNINNINNLNINENLKNNNNDINNNNKNSFEEKKIYEKDENYMRKNYELLSNKIDKLEQNINELYSKYPKKDNKNYNEIIPLKESKTIVIKEIQGNNKENNIIDINNNNELEEKLDKKIKEFSEKLMEMEKEINKIQSDNNIKNYNVNLNINNEQKLENNLNKEETPLEKNKNINSQEKNDKLKEEIKEVVPEKGEENIKEVKLKENLVNKQIAEIKLQINQIKDILSKDESLKKSEFNKYSQKLDIQLKDYNNKINKLLEKDHLRDKMMENINRYNNISSYRQKDEDNNKLDRKNSNSNYVTFDMLQSFESKTRELIFKYISNLDISSNPLILEIQKGFNNLKNLEKDLSSKIDEIIITNNKNNDFNYNLINELKRETKNSTKKLSSEIERITSLQEEIDFFRVFLLGKEEDAKYKSMSQDEKKNELLIGTSIKEEMTIHGNYLKKLSEGLNKVNSRINNLNKETLILIKKDLKAESSNILEDFKSGLKDSINRIETQLKDKVDKLGLDEFWNKINEQLIAEMNEKIDKKEMNKNNQYLKRKIDNLESKISRTLVDTLIDLQMDEAPLVVKRNFREISEKKCASCGQNLPNINNGIMNNSYDFNNLNASQNKIFKPRNIPEKDKLPEIKQNLPK